VKSLQYSCPARIGFHERIAAPILSQDHAALVRVQASRNTIYAHLHSRLCSPLLACRLQLQLL